MYQDHSGIWSRCGCVLGLWWNGRRQSMGAFTFLVVFRSYNHTIWAVLGSVLIDFVQGFMKRWFPIAFLGKHHYLIFMCLCMLCIYDNGQKIIGDVSLIRLPGRQLQFSSSFNFLIEFEILLHKLLVVLQGIHNCFPLNWL